MSYLIEQLDFQRKSSIWSYPQWYGLRIPTCVFAFGWDYERCGLDISLEPSCAYYQSRPPFGSNPTNCANSCQYQLHLTVCLTRSKFRDRALYIIIIIMLFNRNLPIRCQKTSLRAFISVCVLKSGSNTSIETGNVGRYPAKSIIALLYLSKYIISKRFKIRSHFLLIQVF